MKAAGTKGISGAGCLDGVRILKAGAVHTLALVVSAASVRSKRCKDKRNLIAVNQKTHTLIQILFACQEHNFIIRDLHDIGILHAKYHLLSCLILRIPERRAVIGVKGDGDAVILGNRQGFLCRAVHHLIGHGQGSEMEDSGLLNQLAVSPYILRTEHNVRTRLPVKGEITISVCQLLHKRKRCMHAVIHRQAAHVNSLRSGLFLQHLAEGILSDLADEGSLMAEPLQHGQYIAGCTARICLKGRIPL